MGAMRGDIHHLIARPYLGRTNCTLAAVCFAVDVCLGAGSVRDVRPILISQAPGLTIMRSFASERECRMLVAHLAEAVLALNVTQYTIEKRRHAYRYRMMDESRVAVQFKDAPPAILRLLTARAADLLGVPLENVETLLSLSGPSLYGAALTNVHLDNYDASVWPHRVSSMSVFLSDVEGGPTVFPLALPHPGVSNCSAISPSAAEHTSVSTWQRQLNDVRMQSNVVGAWGRRVERADADPFRARVFSDAEALCRQSSGAERSEKLTGCERARASLFRARVGEAYAWKNYDRFGEDDVRAMHGGCSPLVGLKPLLTFFARDAGGPFGEQEGFWDQPVEDPEVLEFFHLVAFRVRHMADLEALRSGAAGAT
eukprot:TRINITY_DN38794_c0_g1_i1.p1 TRINITY_DN38794_c0_g1~~TRINITY_DN38794_c0_g1_i1.p1  ORF type:complete len:370 (-),score=61.95 TRINITY_DN38794_c0_g1_i1:130-1239(-)